MDDLVIRGGTVVDGTGAAPRTADVAITGGRVTAVGRGLGSGRRELDADGLLVAPGWVDIHTHYDGNVLWDPLVAPSSTHGVTTVVTGNCGVGFAPVRPSERDWLIALMEGVEDIPGQVLRTGLTWSWESFPDYLDAVDAAPHAIDVGTQLGHAALRVYAMGERGIDHGAVPTDDERELMGRLAAEAVQAGALGVSTSRSENHRTSDGRLIPTLTASDAELLEIASAVGRTGRGVFEAVFEGVDVQPELALMRRICEVSGRPLSMSTLQRPGQPADLYRQLLDFMTAADRDGLRMRGQVAARPVGLLMSLAGSVHPLRPSPTYQALAAATPDLEALLAELRRPGTRETVLAEIRESGSDLTARFPQAFALGDPPHWERDSASPVIARAAAAGVSPLEIAYDDLAAGGTIYTAVMNYTDGTLAATREMLVHPMTVPGLGDGGAHCTMIADFDFPTFLMSYWTRDAPEDNRVSVEWAVRRQCAETAALVGLTDRGILAPGYRADVNLIDHEHVAVGRPRIVTDLPGGRARLVSDPAGYVATVVAGRVVFEYGAHTGALPGRLVRGAAAA